MGKRGEKKVRVLVTRKFPGPGIGMLEEMGYELTIWDQDRPMTEQELIERSRDQNGLFCTLSERIDSRFLDQCNSLEIVSQFGVGYDNIDVEHASRLGVMVCNTPGVLSSATADIAFGLMISVSRKMFGLHKGIGRGDWNYFRPGEGLGIELKNKTLGILGLGRIGYEMAHRCRGAYNMKVIYHNRNRNMNAEDELGATHVDFETLLMQSDVLSLHANLTGETEGLFNLDTFKMMKPSAIFINTARGTMHDEDDLIFALKNGLIWGAGLDVTNPEPMRPDNPLLSMDNVCVLPHIGSATVETRGRMSELAADSIIRHFDGRELINVVNP